MDREDVRQTVRSLIQKYGWAAIILAVGLLMMCIPEEKESMPEPATQEISQDMTLQQSLEELLSKLDGAGRVKVLLSIRSGERYHYQTDEDLLKTENSADQRKQTVIITSGNREERGLLQRTDPPTYQGAVVLCQGADSPRVKLAVVEAVSTATGLGADQISVLKMK